MNLVKLQSKPLFKSCGIFNPVKKAIKDAITSIYPGGYPHPVKVATVNTEKFATTCCSLAIYSMTDNTSIEEIEYIINRQKQESKLTWTVASRASGEMNLIVITTPHEKNLEENLKKCGFVCIKDDMKRRHGYPPGKLKMWMFILPD